MMTVNSTRLTSQQSAVRKIGSNFSKKELTVKLNIKQRESHSVYLKQQHNFALLILTQHIMRHAIVGLAKNIDVAVL